MFEPTYLTSLTLLVLLIFPTPKSMNTFYSVTSDASVTLSPMIRPLHAPPTNDIGTIVARVYFTRTERHYCNSRFRKYNSYLHNNTHGNRFNSQHKPEYKTVKRF